MLKLSFALLILCGLSRALVCIPTSGPVGMEAMYAEWGAAMRTVAATAVSGVIESPGTDVFTLAAACGDDDWFSCPIGPAGPVTLQGVAGDAVACTAYVHPLCSADVNTDVATVGARGRYTWTAVPTATVVPGGTHGGVPQAYVAASVKYALTRSNSTAADATLEGIRIGCSAPAGHACFVTIDLPGLALDAEIAAGATASLPPVRFVVPAAAIGTELAIVPRASCRNGAAAYPAGPTLAVGLPIARVDPPSGWVASVGSDAWWSDPMFDTGITDEVPVTLGPFDALGVRPAYVPAALSVRSEVLSMAVQLFHAELSRSAPDPILPVTDASFDGTVVVSDVNCVRSAADWAAVAIKTPELLAFIRFPHEIIPGLLTLLSPRHTSRVLWDADSSSYLDAMRGQLVAVQLTLAAGGPRSDDLMTAIAAATAVLRACPVGDSLVWAAIKYNSGTCAGLDDVGIIALLGTFSKYNDGYSGVPSCTRMMA